MSDQIIGLHHWFETPPGRYLLAWEQARIDEAVVDVFGYHSLQVGMPLLDGLRANRMPHRWLALDEWPQPLPEGTAAPQLLAHAVALPFPDNSLDLVLLPHALELSHDPHTALREVARVLVPEGRVLISGVNPASLWGMHTWSRRIPGLQKLPPMPDDRNLIGYGRLRDWLKLLDMELESASFGCYRPALRSEQWLDRWQWLDTCGATAWPVLGGVYFIEAVKKVPGVRLIQAPWRSPSAAPVARPVAARGAIPKKSAASVSKSDDSSY